MVNATWRAKNAKSQYRTSLIRSVFAVCRRGSFRVAFREGRGGVVLRRSFSHSYSDLACSEHLIPDSLLLILSPSDRNFPSLAGPLRKQLTLHVLSPQLNTDMYRTVFRAYPDDQITTYQELTESRSKAQPERYEECMSFVKGFAVVWPMRFLQNENLNFQNNEYAFKYIISD